MMMAGMRGDLEAYLQAAGAKMHAEDVLAQIRAPGIAHLFRIASRLPSRPGDRQAALAEASDLARRLEEVLARADVVAFAFPCEPITAQTIKAPADATPWLVDGKPVTPLTLVRNTSVAPGLGLPAITLPSGLSAEGLPVGLELNAARGRDAHLLAAAAAVERVLGPLAPPAHRPA